MQCDLIARGLSGRGHDVVYAAMKGRGAYDVPYPVHPIPSPSTRSLIRLLRRVRPDVVYWRYNKHHLLPSVLAAKVVRARFVFAISHLYDTLPWGPAGATPLPTSLRQGPKEWLRSTRSLTHALRDRVHYAAVKYVDGVISLNRDFLGRMPVQRQEAIHNAVPTEETAFSWPRPYVVWVANLKPRKNPEKFLALASRCADLEADFLVVGEIQDSRYGYFEDRERLPSNVRYLGKRSPEEVNGMLRGARLLVHTCDPEGFGNNFIQAWRVGCPTVTLHFDPEGLIADERVGFASGTLDRLEADVRQLLADRSLRHEMSGRAARLGERFSADRMVAAVEAFLVATAGEADAEREATKVEARA
jgi:glycosyltransferase involved in cell wall biosynthesis